MRHPILLLLAATMLDASEVAIGRWGGALVISAPASPATSAVKLPSSAQRITLDARELPLTELVDQLRIMTGANWVVGTELLAAPPQITLQVRDMELGNVLRWIERQAGCSITAINQAWFVSRRPPAMAKVTRIYDITDLTQDLADFPGPELALQPGSRGGILVLPPVANAPAPSTDDIADLLERLLAR